MQAQTPEQRRRNAKFAQKNEAKMGKSEDQLKKAVREPQKSPISAFWLGKLRFINLFPTSVCGGGHT